MLQNLELDQYCVLFIRHEIELHHSSVSLPVPHVSLMPYGCLKGTLFSRLLLLEQDDTVLVGGVRYPLKE